MKDQTIRRSLRGAIYTRVSTEQGLETGLQFARCSAGGVRGLCPRAQSEGDKSGVVA
jgi:hypothetical protein